MDLHSDIVILDVQKNILLTSSLLSSADAYETFPCFSSDGKSYTFALLLQYRYRIHLITYDIIYVAWMWIWRKGLWEVKLIR